MRIVNCRCESDYGTDFLIFSNFRLDVVMKLDLLSTGGRGTCHLIWGSKTQYYLINIPYLTTRSDTIKLAHTHAQKSCAHHAHIHTYTRSASNRMCYMRLIPNTMECFPGRKSRLQNDKDSDLGSNGTADGIL